MLILDRNMHIYILLGARITIKENSYYYTLYLFLLRLLLYELK